MTPTLYCLGEGGLPYISHIGMCRPKGYAFWAFLVCKRVYINFAHFGLELGMVFEGTMGVYERTCIHLSLQFQMNKYEIKLREFKMHLKNFFVCTLI